MRKITSAELFRIPSNDFYMVIQGDDFYSSGIFSVREEFLSKNVNLPSKGIGFDCEGDACLLEGVNDSRAEVYLYKGVSFDDLVVESKKEESILNRVQLSEFTRQGVLYATYSRGFISLPAKIVEFVLKYISNKETLWTNGKTLFVMREDEVIAMIETCDEPNLSASEKEIIVQLGAQVI